MKLRLDRLLVDRGLVPSREKAQGLIMSGNVLIDESPVFKAGQLTNVDALIRIKEEMPYVSRGGLKLQGALEAFGLSVEGVVAMDIGSSTGGFTDVLLQRGAARVYAVDVDTRQLDWKLVQDRRVIPIRKNARFLEAADVGEEVFLATIDVSFISVRLILPRIVPMLTAGGLCCTLVKPQFELKRGDIGKGGVVRDTALHERAVISVKQAGVEAGLRFEGEMESPIRGKEGNREFFILFRKV